jgi:capsular polysaccharide transport system permease protein
MERVNLDLRMSSDATARFLSPAQTPAALKAPSRLQKLSAIFVKYRSLLIFVALPTLIAAIYLFFICSKQYVAEFEFTILPAEVQSSSNANSPSSTGQSGVLASSSAGGSTALLSIMDNMVMNYLVSHQAVVDTQRTVDLKAMFDRDGIDPLHRFWWNDGSFERLTQYWRFFIVSATYDTTTGICDVKVSAYSPQDAQKIAKTLAGLSEQLINNQSARQLKDAVRYSEQAYQTAKVRLDQSLIAEKNFRQSHQSIDPAINGAANLTLDASLQQTLASLRAQANALQRVSPEAPALALLRSQIQASEQQLKSVAGQIGNGDVSHGAGHDGVPIATAMQSYEAIEDEKSFATLSFTNALQARNNAILASTQQQYYLAPFVEPTQPQAPVYPRPFLGTFLVFLTVLALWGVGKLFFDGSRRHV